MHIYTKEPVRCLRGTSSDGIVFAYRFGRPIAALSLRSLPPFTGVPRGPGLKVPHGVLFEQFWAPASECPKEWFLAFFGGQKRQKALKKHSLGHSEAGAQNCSKGTPWSTFRPGPRGTPVNGGRDRKLRVHLVCLNLAFKIVSLML